MPLPWYSPLAQSPLADCAIAWPRRWSVRLTAGPCRRALACWARVGAWRMPCSACWMPCASVGMRGVAGVASGFSGCGEGLSGWVARVAGCADGADGLAALSGSWALARGGASLRLGCAGVCGAAEAVFEGLRCFFAETGMSGCDRVDGDGSVFGAGAIARAGSLSAFGGDAGCSGNSCTWMARVVAGAFAFGMGATCVVKMPSSNAPCIANASSVVISSLRCGSGAGFSMLCV